MPVVHIHKHQTVLPREFRAESAPAGWWRIPNAFTPIGAVIGRLFDLRLP